MEKNKVLNFVSLIPVLVIVISAFSPELISVFNKPIQTNILEIPIAFDKLDYYDTISQQQLIDHLNRELYVPNYDAEIRITPYKDPVRVTDNLKFKITVKDKGILRLDKPYFYLYVIDPKDKLQACFPNCKYEYNKMQPWSLTSQPQSSKGGSYSLDFPILTLKINNALFGFSRESLMEGNGYYRFESGNTLYPSKERAEFYYTVPVNEIGTWKIYALVFNEEYKNRRGNNFYSDVEGDRDVSNNIVNYAENIITVKGNEETLQTKTPTWPLIFKFFAVLIVSLLTYRGIYSFIGKHYEGFMGLVKEMYGLRQQRHFYMGVAIIVIMFLIIQLLILRKVA